MFGCSTSAVDKAVTPAESYWGLTAEYLKIPIINNCSRPVNSLDAIAHLLISMQEQYDWSSDLFLISVPPLERITVFDDHKDTTYYGYKIETESWSREQYRIPYLHGLVGLQNFGNDKKLILHRDPSWNETQALRTVFLLTNWLDSVKANYIIHNTSGRNFDKNNQWGPSEFVLPYAINHPRCILFENTYHSINENINRPADFDQYKWHGHHGSAGNSYFFEKSLLPTMQKCNLI